MNVKGARNRSGWCRGTRLAHKDRCGAFSVSWNHQQCIAVGESLAPPRDCWHLYQLIYHCRLASHILAYHSMADRGAKRLRRLSTDYDDSEGADDWGRDKGSSSALSRYVDVAGPSIESCSPFQPRVRRGEYETSPTAAWPLYNPAPLRSPLRRATTDTPVRIPARSSKKTPLAAFF